MRRQQVSINIHELSSQLSERKSEECAGGWQSYVCKLVTPMYGGGVKAGEVDKDMPIRAASIRGQLRFWWRVACGPFENKKEEMFLQKESAIWGGIGSDGATASKVQIRVKCKKANSQNLVGSETLTGLGIKYALGAAKNTSCLQGGYAFSLDIRCHEDVEGDVQQALRWWATFGGIGARTRRGFGAVEVEGVEHVDQATVEKVGAKLTLISTSYNSAEKAWQVATERLHHFRQGKNTGRNPGSGNRPGRSRWPEPDQLRRMAEKHKSGHEPEHKAGNVFPRAAFGMPIIFDFNDRKNTEPATMTLLPKGSERMASPLILRPYWDGKCWKAAALLLPGWQAVLKQELVLTPNPCKDPPRLWPKSGDERQQVANHIPPMNKENQLRANDPLTACMDFFEKGK